MIPLITYSNNAIYFDRIHDTLSSIAARKLRQLVVYEV